MLKSIWYNGYIAFVGGKGWKIIIIRKSNL